MARCTTILAALALGLILAVALLIPLAWHRFEVWATAVHQRGVTRELAAWEQEYTPIEKDWQASRAVDMLRYVQGYYVPGPGYRSDPATEAALERQRQHTMTALAEALENFTGETYGTDVDQWEAWRDRRQRR